MPHPARPTVTLHDVAAAAGVSVATASRVLGGSTRTVAPALSERVLAAAASLHYTPDASARAMRRGNESITLIADDLTTPSIAMMVAAMERQARRAGGFVSVASTRGAPERQLETIRRLRALRPRALVLTSGRISADALGGRLLDELRAYEGEGGRVVVVGDTDLAFDSISFDNRGAARLVGRYLAGSGHRRVVILAGPPDGAAATARVAGFTEGLIEGGVEPRDIGLVHGEMSRQGGVDGAARLLAAGFAGTDRPELSTLRRSAPDGTPGPATAGTAGPGTGGAGGRDARGSNGSGTDRSGPPGLSGIDALVAANDVVAIGALNTLRAAGVRVPQDVSVTGFDDIPLAADVTPRLTTVALPLGEAGAEAIRFATRRRTTTAHLLLRGDLVVRESTGERPRHRS